jgi:Tol biopolymer transport system component
VAASLALTIVAILPIRAHALTMCYVDHDDNVVCKVGDAAPKTVADTGYELALSPDGSRLLYTRDEKGMERTLVIYDLKSGKPHDLLKGVVRLGKWSPDGKTIAFLKNVPPNWQVWTMPADAPAKAAPIYKEVVEEIHQWTPDGKGLLIFDDESLKWITLAGKVSRSILFDQIYGSFFEWDSDDHFRINPNNPDLLIGGASYSTPPPGAPVDALKLASAVFQYDTKSNKLTPITPNNVWAKDPEWAPDGKEIYFTRLEKDQSFSICKLKPDGTGIQKVVDGEGVTLAK